MARTDTGADDARPIRVLVADDGRTTRTLVAHLISSETDLALVGVAENAQEAILLAAERQPDVALIDVFMPDGGGLRATQHIRVLSPDTRMLALSASDDPHAVLRMLQAGCVGYLVKDETIGRLPDAVRDAASGRATLAPAIASSVIDALVIRLDLEDKHTQRLAETHHAVEGLLATDGVRLVFQPIVELETGRVLGVEALSRFPPQPSYPPHIWFAQAAEAGLGVELELHVVRKALAALEHLPEPLYLCCNVSPVVAGGRELVDVLAAAPAADRLVVEVTEHAPVSDYDGLDANMTLLRGAGVRLSVDDIGAGFASLRHVVQLRPDFVKLDASLTRGIDADRAREVLAKGILSLAASVDATVIAEGVETPGEMELLRRVGVQAAQGYHWCRPIPLDDVLEWCDLAASPSRVSNGA